MLNIIMAKFLYIMKANYWRISVLIITLICIVFLQLCRHKEKVDKTALDKHMDSLIGRSYPKAFAGDTSRLPDSVVVKMPF